MAEFDLPEGVSPGDGAWRYGWPARLPDGWLLVLCIRQLPADPTAALASLISNQVSLQLVDALGVMLARLLAPYAPEVVVGLPTLGLARPPVVARESGHEQMVPLSYSRKYWFEEAMSARGR